MNLEIDVFLKITVENCNFIYKYRICGDFSTYKEKQRSSSICQGAIIEEYALEVLYKLNYSKYLNKIRYLSSLEHARISTTIKFSFLTAL